MPKSGTCDKDVKNCELYDADAAGTGCSSNSYT